MTTFAYDSPSPDNPRSLRVPNRRARSVIEFAIQTAEGNVASAADRAEFDRVSRWYEASFFDGMIVDVAALFPAAGSRRFWCRAFLDAARAVVRGEVGNASLQFWKARAVCDLSTVGRMLLHAAADVEPQWAGPLPRDLAEEQAWNERPPDAGA